MIQFTHIIPTKILFGSGRVKRLHKQSLPGTKALLVISNGNAVRANGALQLIKEELEKAGVTVVVFNSVEANPLDSSVMAGAALAREQECDFVVALGGGSVLDAAKVMAFMATHPGEVWDYISGGTGKNSPRLCNPLPLICIPTTAGTGSEADPYGVISNDRTKEKIGFWADFPVLSIVDPELTLSVPPLFTAYQGFDALFHATECYISSKANAMSDMYAIAAIQHIAPYLPRAVANGSDIEAREHIALGSTLAGMVMNISSTTAKHALEHAMSAHHHHLPHGAGLIMIAHAFYSHLIKRNVCNNRFVQMARVMGVTEANEPQDFLTALELLKKACGVHNLKMSNYGIAPQEFEALAENAKETMGVLFLATPTELDNKDCVEILTNAYC